MDTNQAGSEVFWGLSGLFGVVFLVSLTLLVLNMPINLTTIFLGLMVFLFGSIGIGIAGGCIILGYFYLITAHHHENEVR